MEPGARDRRRRRLLRNDGRLVQGDRRAHRQAAVAVQDRQRDHRPADQLSRARRPPIYRGRRRASAAGPARSSSAELDPRDPTARARLRQCGQGPAEARPRREACSMSSRFRVSLPIIAAAGARACGVRARGTPQPVEAARRDRAGRAKPRHHLPGGGDPPAARSARRSSTTTMPRRSPRASGSTAR